MGRNPDPIRKSALVSEAADYVLRHGLATLSLRPLAADLGTSARNLLYHFETAAKLVDLILNEIKQRELRILIEQLGDQPNDPTDVLDILWKHMNDQRSIMRIYLELAFSSVGSAQLSDNFFNSLLADWSSIIEQSMTKIDSNHDLSTSSLAQIITATTWGSFVLAEFKRPQNDTAYAPPPQSETQEQIQVLRHLIKKAV